jgi:hypothetical protein
MAAVAAPPATGVRGADGSAWRGAWGQGCTCGRRRRERMARSLGASAHLWAAPTGANGEELGGSSASKGAWVLAPSEERGRRGELLGLPKKIRVFCFFI